MGSSEKSQAETCICYKGKEENRIGWLGKKLQTTYRCTPTLV